MNRLVLTPDQYNDGYRCNPHIKLGHHKISYETKQFKFVEKLNNGNYVVLNPRSYNDD